MTTLNPEGYGYSTAPDTDPEGQRIDAIAQQAGEELDAMVVMLVVRHDRKRNHAISVGNRRNHIYGGDIPHLLEVFSRMMYQTEGRSPDSEATLGMATEELMSMALRAAVMNLPGMDRTHESTVMTEVTETAKGASVYMKFMSDHGVTDDANGAVLAKYLTEKKCPFEQTRARSLTVQMDRLMHALMVGELNERPTH